MNRPETQVCHTCGGSITSPGKGFTSDEVAWLVANKWRMTVDPENGVRYFCVACGLPKEKIEMEDIF